MKHLLTLLTISIISCSFGQNDTLLEEEVMIERLVQLAHKECYFFGHGANPSKKEINNMKTVTASSRLPFETLDSLFQSEDYKTRLYAFHAMCTKNISKISDVHKTIFRDTTTIMMCTPDGPVNSNIAVGQYARLNFDEISKMQEEGLKLTYDHNIQKKDSIINDIFQTEIDYWKQINQFDSSSVKSKKAQNIQLLHNEHHDRVYRTYVRSITDYLIEAKNKPLIKKFVQLILVSTNSVDEVQACQFVKLFIALPEIVLELAEESKPKIIKSYLRDHLEFCVDPENYQEKEIDQFYELIESN